jgi:hypothetical protein
LLKKTVDKEHFNLLFSCGFRSGAGLLTSILNANKEVSICIDILKYWNFCHSRYPDTNRNTLSNMLEELNSRLSVRFSITLDINRILEKAGDIITHPNIYRLILQQVYCMDRDSRILGECEGLTWSKIPYYLDNISNSKAMLIIRDPRDVLVSFKKNTIAPDPDYLVAVFNCLGMMQSALEYSRVYKDRFMCLRFEDLKAQPKEVVQAACQFLGITYNEEMLNPLNWKKLGHKKWVPWENHGSSSFSEDIKLQQSPVGRWRGMIDPLDHFICEWVLSDVMAEFEYIPEFNSPSQEMLDTAVTRLSSSSLLESCLYSFQTFNLGTEKYPLDPFNPVNWDNRYTDNPDRLKEIVCK